jgi:hypothetical protein
MQAGGKINQNSQILLHIDSYVMLVVLVVLLKEVCQSSILDLAFNKKDFYVC